MPLHKQLRTGDVKYLNKLVSSHDRSAFLQAVKSGSLAAYFHRLTTFPISSASDLGLDSEHRLFGETVSIDNKILNVSELGIRNSREVSLFNCVVLGDLTIGGKGVTTKIYIDNCLVLGLLCICGNDQDPNLEVTMWNSNCTVLKINSNQIKVLDVGASNIHDCHLVNTRCESLRMTSNHMRYFQIEDLDVVRCDFFHGQVELSGSFPAKPVRSTREAEDIDWENRADVLLDFSLGTNIKSSALFETLAFLRNRTLINSDQGKLSELRYRAALLSQSKISKAFVWLTHGFESPVLFAAYAAAILLLSTLLYMSRICKFVHNSDAVFQGGGYQLHSGVSFGLHFPEALYFSSITFTTVGYGDLVPIGIARLFAASEALFGVALAGSFLVALVKRYIEK